MTRDNIVPEISWGVCRQGQPEPRECVMHEEKFSLKDNMKSVPMRSAKPLECKLTRKEGRFTASIRIFLS